MNLLFHTFPDFGFHRRKNWKASCSQCFRKRVSYINFLVSCRKTLMIQRQHRPLFGCIYRTYPWVLTVQTVLAFDFSWPSLVSFSPDPSKGSEGPRGEVRRNGKRIWCTDACQNQRWPSGLFWVTCLYFSSSAVSRHACEDVGKYI